MRRKGSLFFSCFIRSLMALVLPVFLFCLTVLLYERLRAPYDRNAVGFALFSDRIILFDRTFAFPFEKVFTGYGKIVVEPFFRPLRQIFEGMLMLLGLR